MDEEEEVAAVWLEVELVAVFVVVVLVSVVLVDGDCFVEFCLLRDRVRVGSEALTPILDLHIRTRFLFEMCEGVVEDQTLDGEGRRRRRPA